jgi:NADH-quinone oxidoreductase subunit N
MINELVFFAPELILLFSVIILIILGSYFKTNNVPSIVTIIAVFSLVFALFLVNQQSSFGEILYENMAITNQFTAFAKVILLVSSLISIMLAHNWLIKQQHGAFEYPIMVLLATIGLSLVISANNLLAFYLSIEMASLCMYVMAAYERDNYYSSEAGIKYFILGSLASCIMLFGISLIYGFAGSIAFAEIAQANYSIGATTGLVLVIIALCFKLSAAPFHMWSPDVYQGAPTPVVAFFAVAPKIAVLAFMVRLLGGAFEQITDYWQQVIIFASVTSMLIGAVGGIAQTNIKRLIAYSSIGHMGYILLAVIAGTEEAISYMLVYIATYVMMNVGLFALLLILQKNDAKIENIKDLAGLSHKHPKLALSFAIIIFSMAGIPPFAGFFAKALLLMSAVDAGFTPLVVVALICSVISCFYYIRIVKLIYFDEAEGELSLSKDKILFGSVIIASLAINFIVFSPAIILEPAKAAARALF